MIETQFNVANAPITAEGDAAKLDRLARFKRLGHSPILDFRRIDTGKSGYLKIRSPTLLFIESAASPSNETGIAFCKQVYPCQPLWILLPV